MGYDLHITRKEHWADEDGPAVASEEWLRVVEEDPELRPAGENGPYFAIWSGPSEYDDPWLDWFEGNVYTKNPDPPLIRKMVAIADRLGAKVQGDDGETYDEAWLAKTERLDDEAARAWRRSARWRGPLVVGLFVTGVTVASIAACGGLLAVVDRFVG